MPRVRLDIADDDGRPGATGDGRPDIRIDTDVFATLSGEQTTSEPASAITRLVRRLRP